MYGSEDGKKSRVKVTEEEKMEKEIDLENEKRGDKEKDVEKQLSFTFFFSLFSPPTRKKTFFFSLLF